MADTPNGFGIVFDTVVTTPTLQGPAFTSNPTINLYTLTNLDPDTTISISPLADPGFIINAVVNNGDGTGSVNVAFTGGSGVYNIILRCTDNVANFADSNTVVTTASFVLFPFVCRILTIDIDDPVPPPGFYAQALSKRSAQLPFNKVIIDWYFTGQNNGYFQVRIKRSETFNNNQKPTFNIGMLRFNPVGEGAAIYATTPLTTSRWRTDLGAWSDLKTGMAGGSGFGPNGAITPSVNAGTTNRQTTEIHGVDANTVMPDNSDVQGFPQRAQGSLVYLTIYVADSVTGEVTNPV